MHWAWFLLAVLVFTAGEILASPQAMSFVADWAPPDGPRPLPEPLPGDVVDRIRAQPGDRAAAARGARRARVLGLMPLVAMPAASSCSCTSTARSTGRRAAGLCVGAFVGASGGFPDWAGHPAPPDPPVRVTIPAMNASPFPLEPDAGRCSRPRRARSPTSSSLRSRASATSPRPTSTASRCCGRRFARPCPRPAGRWQTLLCRLEAAIAKTYNTAGPGYLAYIPGGGVYARRSPTSSPPPRTVTWVSPRRPRPSRRSRRRPQRGCAPSWACRREREASSPREDRSRTSALS